MRTASKDHQSLIWKQCSCAGCPTIFSRVPPNYHFYVHSPSLATSLPKNVSPCSLITAALELNLRLTMNFPPENTALAPWPSPRECPGGRARPRAGSGRLGPYGLWKLAIILVICFHCLSAPVRSRAYAERPADRRDAYLSMVSLSNSCVKIIRYIYIYLIIYTHSCLTRGAMQMFYV